MFKVKQHKATLCMLLHHSSSNKGLPALEAGISIIELLVGVGIFALSVSTLLGFLVFALSTSSFLKQQTQAITLAEGALEALKNFRDGTVWNVDDPEDQYDGLGQVSTGVSYHMGMSGDVPPRWQLLAQAETVGIFSSAMVFENVQRDVDSNIVSAGGIDDPNTKKVTVTVSWTERARTHQVDIVSYFTNWRQ